MAEALDYYELYPSGLLIEEFVFDDDLCAMRLRSAGWTPADAGWWSSAAFAQALRTDPHVRARVAAIDRAGAETTYRRLGGGTLPDEAALRGRFRDDVPLAAGQPLRLGTGAGVHRMLFAGELDGDRLAALRTSLQVDGVDGLRLNGTDFRWELRRVAGVAWSVDLRSELAAPFWLLRQLTSTARRHGLIPVTVERLS